MIKQTRIVRRTFLQQSGLAGALFFLPGRWPTAPRTALGLARVSAVFVSGGTPAGCRIALSRPQQPPLELFAYRPAALSPATLPVRIVVEATAGTCVTVVRGDAPEERWPLCAGVQTVSIGGGASVTLQVEAVQIIDSASSGWT